MKLKTLYQTSDGKTFEVKRDALDHEEYIKLQEVTRELVLNTADQSTAKTVLQLIDAIKASELGAEAVYHFYKACSKHNPKFRRLSVPVGGDPNEIKELGWEALDTLKDMVRFCLDGRHAIGDARLTELHIRELIRFSGYQLEE